MEPIIQVKNVGKKYNIRHFQGGYIALRDVLMNIIKSPFQFAKRKVQSVTGIGTHEEFWALKNISFDINAGEIIGVIGRNGAGKSTLLKILTGITPPSTGEIKMRGRVASLLEVGTGFHPELTGRENIFLNGAILGMKRKEIAEKFDEIVAFSGVEKFLDTPVKYYSSGMYVRLAFSVAAHMEPDILLVDEVLAVGDAEFQKKCLGKMESVTKEAGRTILFVSHNLSAIQNLCKKTILIEKGEIVMFAKTEKVIEHYLSNKNQRADHFVSKDTIVRTAEVKEIKWLEKEDGQNIKLGFDIVSQQDGLGLDITIRHNMYPVFFISSAYYSDLKINKNTKKIEVDIGPVNLATGSYQIDIKVCKPFTAWLESHENVLEFTIDEKNTRNKFNFELSAERYLGFIVPPQKWIEK